jgi:hypothetical protein
MIDCGKCRYKNPDDAKFCSLCSNKLDPSRAKKAPPADHFMFEPRMLGGGGPNRRATGNLGAPEREKHFLVPPTGEPARIEPGTVYLMGRDEAAQIRITAPRVSRKHAEIRFKGDKPAVYDLGSQNGTIVNGAKLEKDAHKDLVDRDVVDVGGITMTYRLLKAGEPESKLAAVGSETTLVGPEDEADLTGNAALMPIKDVLDRLAKLKATGLLVVETTDAKGAVRVEDGIAVAGTWAGKDGPNAIAAVRALAKGKFSFEMSDPGAAPSVVVVPDAPTPKQPPAPHAATPAAKKPGPPPAPGGEKKPVPRPPRPPQ